MTTSTRINAFLWNRVSQGYSRVVKDKPPFESWRAWRAGHRDYEPVLYLTPASSPVRELPSELDGVSAAAAAAERARPGSSSDCGAGNYDTTAVRTVTAPPILVAAVVEAASTGSSALTSYSEGATGSRRGVGVAAAGGTGNGDGDEEAEELEYTSYKEVTVLTATLTGPPDSQGWDSPFPSFSSGPSQSSSSSSSGGSSRSTNTSTSDQRRKRREMKICLNHNAPEDFGLAVVECTFRRREDVKNFSKHVPPRITHILKFLLEPELRAIYA